MQQVERLTSIDLKHENYLFGNRLHKYLIPGEHINQGKSASSRSVTNGITTKLSVLRNKEFSIQ